MSEYRVTDGSRFTVNSAHYVVPAGRTLRLLLVEWAVAGEVLAHPEIRSMFLGL